MSLSNEDRKDIKHEIILYFSLLAYVAFFAGLIVIFNYYIISDSGNSPFDKYISGKCLFDDKPNLNIYLDTGIKYFVNSKNVLENQRNFNPRLYELHDYIGKNMTCYVFFYKYNIFPAIEIQENYPYKKYLFFYFSLSVLFLCFLFPTIKFCYNLWFILKNRKNDPDMNLNDIENGSSSDTEIDTIIPNVDTNTLFSMEDNIIPTSIQEENSNSDEPSDPDNECAICFKNLYSNNQKIAQPWQCCNKLIHEQCMLQWLANNDTCVWCQKKVID